MICTHLYDTKFIFFAMVTLSSESQINNCWVTNVPCLKYISASNVYNLPFGLWCIIIYLDVQPFSGLLKNYDIINDHITVFPVNWMYNIWKRRLQACTSNSPEPPSYLTGSLQAVASGSHDGGDEGSQYPDTTTAGPQLDVPLSPLEMRQLTNNLGRLYHSC